MNNDAFVMTSKRSIREAFTEASSFFNHLGIMEPQRNAQILLEHVLGLSSTTYYMALPDPFPTDAMKKWEEVVNRKAAGEPAQYIIGEQEFYGLAFDVSSAVLIPRPETELLVEAVLQQAERVWSSQAKFAPLVVADIGTGSGAIAVTLASMSPGWQICASDISSAALSVAKRNAVRHTTVVDFREGNLLEPFAGMKLDILVSNPPYIPADDIVGLQPEVRDFEPILALDGGEDGLLPYRIMMEQIAILAEPPTLIGFELGIGQADDVATLLREAGHWTEIITIADLAGIDRHVIGVNISV
ncbi:peptide chain release factor N(5)-glutamine methyltransferase [Paenibacillus sp. CMAA1364]